MRALRRAPPAVMATLRFLLKRFVAQRSLGLAVVVTLAFTVGVLVAGPIYADAAREAILSSSLGSESVTVTNARLQVFGGADFDWDAADGAITSAFGAVPVDTARAAGPRHGAPRRSRRPVGAARSSATAPPSTSRSRASAPGAGEVALPAGTAAALGLEAGDTSTSSAPTTSRSTFAVSGTFESPRSRRPVLVRRPQPVPGPGLDRPAAAARRSGDVPRCRRAARPHDASTRGTRSSRSTALPFEQASRVPASSPRSRTRSQAQPGPVLGPAGRAASARSSTSSTCA